MTNTTTYVNQLEVAVQEEIKSALLVALEGLGLEQDELVESMENAMDSRLCDLQDLISIEDFLIVAEEENTVAPTTYVKELSTDIQKAIKDDITEVLANEIQDDTEFLDAIENAMNSRLCDLQDLIDISVYTGGNN